MKRYVLDVFADGHAIISGSNDLTPADVEELRRVWRDWQNKPEAMMILNGEVRRHEFNLVDDELRIAKP